MSRTLDHLYETITNRRNADPEISYTATLFAAGIDRIAQKVGEEAVETVLAAQNPDRARLIAEMADLWYHCLVLLVSRDISLDDIYAELETRAKTSRSATDSNRDPQ